MSDTTTAIIVAPPQAMIQRQELSVEDVLERRKKAVQLVKSAMTEGVDFGPPFAGSDKPTLLQPGADKLANLFNFGVRFGTPRSVLEANFIRHEFTCTIVHIPTALTVSEGLGSCNSREKKYGKRKIARQCPSCGAAAIIKGKAEYGGGFLCWKKNGGCGEKFNEKDPKIVDQPEGEVDNPDIWEQENTILKMAMKRAKISAILNSVGLTDIFTQDLDDMHEFAGVEAVTLPEEEAHREGHQHQSQFCQKCAEAGVPDGWDVTLLKEHLYIRRKNPATKKDESPIHDFEHNCHEYCPPCRADWDRQDKQVPPVRCGTGDGAGFNPSSPAPRSSGSVADAPGVAGAGPAKADQPANAGAAGDDRAITSPAAPAIITDKQHKRLMAITKAAGWSHDELKALLALRSIASSKDVPKERYEKLCEYIEKNPKKPKEQPEPDPWDAYEEPEPEPPSDPEPLPIEDKSVSDPFGETPIKAAMRALGRGDEDMGDFLRDFVAQWVGGSEPQEEYLAFYALIVLTGKDFFDFAKVTKRSLEIPFSKSIHYAKQSHKWNKEGIAAIAKILSDMVAAGQTYQAQQLITKAK